MLFLNFAQRRELDRLQKVALDNAQARREEAVALDRDWKEAARTFTEGEASDELTALALRRDAGDLTREQHDAKANSIRARTIVRATIADRLAALNAEPRPIDKLTDAQVDALWEAR